MTILIVILVILAILAALGFGAWKLGRGRGGWKRLLVAFALGVALLYLAYPGAYTSYRLTLDVETPDGMKSGSGVVRLNYAVIPQFLGSSSCGHSGVSRGEAVTVDLGQRGTFYALLVGRNETTGQPDQGLDPATAFIKTLAPHLWVKACERSKIFELMLLKAKAEVPLKHIPFLVRFRDEKDPKTVEAVDPSNLAASFGVGVRLKRVTMETTSDAVTTSIEKRLGWLGQYYAMRLDGDRSVAHAVPPPSLANALSSGTFKVPKE